MRRAFTLVECMLASAILGILALSLFEGVIVATRIAHENAELLAAEAIAWDAVWVRFNGGFEKLSIEASAATLDANSAWQLVPVTTEDGQTLREGYANPVLTVSVGPTDETGFSRSAATMKKITADVEWGPLSRRRKLSAEGRAPCVFRSQLGRAN